MKSKIEHQFLVGDPKKLNTIPHFIQFRWIEAVFKKMM